LRFTLHVHVSRSIGNRIYNLSGDLGIAVNKGAVDQPRFSNLGASLFNWFDLQTSTKIEKVQPFASSRSSLAVAGATVVTKDRFFGPG
jgi:hypothetical protein